jgi:hypothetical protein
MTSHRITGIAGVPPAMSAKREKVWCVTAKISAPAARCGRDARDPSKELPLTIKEHL